MKRHFLFWSFWSPCRGIAAGCCPNINAGGPGGQKRRLFLPIKTDTEYPLVRPRRSYHIRCLRRWPLPTLPRNNQSIQCRRVGNSKSHPRTIADRMNAAFAMPVSPNAAEEQARNRIPAGKTRIIPTSTIRGCGRKKTRYPIRPKKKRQSVDTEFSCSFCDTHDKKKSFHKFWTNYDQGNHKISIVESTFIPKQNYPNWSSK